MNRTDYRKSTDEELMLHFQKTEDSKAFDELVLRYQDKIVNFIFQYTGNMDDSEDLAQDSFFKLYKYRHSYKEIAKFSTWFYTIIINVTRDRYNKDKFYTSVDIDDINEYELQTDDLIQNTFETDESDEDEYRLSCIKKAFEELDEVFKEVILLRYTEGLEYEKIAEILSIPEGTVKSRINRGREHIKKSLVKIYRG